MANTSAVWGASVMDTLFVKGVAKRWAKEEVQGDGEAVEYQHKVEHAAGVVLAAVSSPAWLPVVAVGGAGAACLYGASWLADKSANVNKVMKVVAWFFGIIPLGLLGAGLVVSFILAGVGEALVLLPALVCFALIARAAWAVAPYLVIVLAAACIAVAIAAAVVGGPVLIPLAIGLSAALVLAAIMTAVIVYRAAKQPPSHTGYAAL